MENTKTPMKAIRAKCLDCCCNQIVVVRECHIKTCPLWPYRMGMKMETAEKKAQKRAEKRESKKYSNGAAESGKVDAGSASIARTGKERG